MTDVVHANAFFFISSVATILLVGALLIAAYYIVKILRDVSRITAKLSKASNELERDFENLRREVKNEGVKVRAIADIALGFLMSRMNAIKKKAATRKPKAAKIVDAIEIEEELQ